MAELEDFFDESVLRFFENEEVHRPVEEEEIAEEEEKRWKLMAAIIGEVLLSEEFTASELERL